jgi:CRP-like cAMP-binding protein
VSRWATDRDFYVILDGDVSVRLDDVVLQQLGPGDFFGEIAASDWGSGYGYLRTADIGADSHAAVRLVPTEVLSDLMASEQALRERVLAARSDRLTRM